MSTRIPNFRGVGSIAALVGATFLRSCATPVAQPSKLETPYVRKVDFSNAPEMKGFAVRARQTGNEMYPKVCELLTDGNLKFPRQFDICFKKRLASGNSGETRMTQICLNAGYLDQLQEDPAAFDQMVVHEMTHVAQYYCRPILGRWVYYNSNPPLCWQEGIADYVCFKLGETNGWRCPQCGFAYPHYRSGYSCAGTFLLYLDTTYNSNIVRQLNTVLRQGGYSDQFFAKATGKDLPELWAEFEQTAAFTSNAARMLEFQQALGYVNGKPPKNIKQRFKEFVDQHADPLTKDLLKSAHILGPADDLQTRMAVYLYFTQPGGTAEAYLTNLKQDNQAPGFSKGEQGQINGFLKFRDLDPTFPVTRSFTATKRGDSSTYHYTVFRASLESSWKLQRAWRTSPDGKVAEEYPIPQNLTSR